MTLHWHRNARSTAKCRVSYRWFNTKMHVEYDDQDLKGLMETVQREIQSSSQVPNVIVEETFVDDAGNEERKNVFSKFIFDYNKGKEFFIICKN